MPETNNANTRTNDITAMYVDEGILSRLQADLRTYSVTQSRSTDSELDITIPALDTENTVASSMDELVAQMERRQNERKFDHAFTID